LVCLLRNP